MRQVTAYIAEDGSLFTVKKECKNYEENLHNLQEIFLLLSFFDEEQQEIKLTLEDLRAMKEGESINIGSDEVWNISVAPTSNQKIQNDILEIINYFDVPDNIIDFNGSVIFYDPLDGNWKNVDKRLSELKEEIKELCKLKENVL